MGVDGTSDGRRGQRGWEGDVCMNVLRDASFKLGEVVSYTFSLDGGQR